MLSMDKRLQQAQEQEPKRREDLQKGRIRIAPVKESQEKTSDKQKAGA